MPDAITVAATDRNDQLASFSNYRLAKVDIGAPGTISISTFPGVAYSGWNETFTTASN